MYQIIRKLNNNAIIAHDLKRDIQVIILLKGIGFSAKVDSIINEDVNMSIYVIDQKQSDEISTSVDPIFLEIANDILQIASKRFGGKVDTNVLLPLADHIDFASQRMKQSLNISNPFANDIKLLFPEEYQIALEGKAIIEQKTGINIPEDEVGYITLHVHSSLSDDLVSTSMQLAILVQETIGLIEKELNIVIDQYSISYVRLLNHIKYMLLRLQNNEYIEIDMQDYVKERFPNAYKVATKACEYMSKISKKQLPEVEKSYLALHIERIMNTNKYKKEISEY